MSITVILLIGITLLSTLGGWLLSRSKQEKAIKVLTFMLYFWLLAFVQLTIFALAYHFNWVKF